MSILTSPPTAPTVDEVCLLLTDAASSTTELARTGLAAGVARRLTKLSRQFAAAERLLAGGPTAAESSARHLATCRVLARRQRGCTDLDVVDGNIAAMGRAIVALHAWRGHVDCVPADQRH